MRATPRFGAALLALAAGAALANALPQQGTAQQDAARVDWPQFRGPNRDGISPEIGLLDAWPEAGPQRRWRRALGDGYGGMAIAGGVLYTMFGRDGGEWLTAIDTTDGATRWEYRMDDLYRDSQGNGPRATPSVSGGLVIALGARGVLAAVDAASGDAHWVRNLHSDFGARPPRWGYSGSPLVDGNLLLVDAGGSDGAGVLALRTDTGAEVWRALETNAGYAAPINVAIGGLRQTVFFTAEALAGVETTSGRPLWQFPWQTSYDVNAATPILVPPDGLFVASGYGVGGALLQLHVDNGEVTVRELWRTSEMKNQFSSSILVGGHLYGFDNTIFMCVEAATGQRAWRTRGFGQGSLIAADGNLIVLGEDGTLALVAPSPAEFREISRAQIFQSKTWTMPSLADGTLYVRDQRELVALDLRVHDRP